MPSGLESHKLKSYHIYQKFQTKNAKYTIGSNLHFIVLLTSKTNGLGQTYILWIKTSLIFIRGSIFSSKKASLLNPDCGFCSHQFIGAIRIYNIHGPIGVQHLRPVWLLGLKVIGLENNIDPSESNNLAAEHMFTPLLEHECMIILFSYLSMPCTCLE